MIPASTARLLRTSFPTPCSMVRRSASTVQSVWHRGNFGYHMTGEVESVSSVAVDWRSFPPLVMTDILTASLELFDENGYHGTTVRQIANRVGGNRSRALLSPREQRGSSRRFVRDLDE